MSKDITDRDHNEHVRCLACGHIDHPVINRRKKRRARVKKMLQAENIDIFSRGPDRSLPTGYWASWDNPANKKHISVSFSPKDEKEHGIVWLFMWEDGKPTQEIKFPTAVDLNSSWKWLYDQARPN